jgi:hypothetical protein|tara:strand:- start:229 stop:450 length:222 start_codon:yes stop_codon:yes gene_type:complete
MRKTRLEKAMNNDFAKENPFDNIDQAILLAKELKVYDVIDPNGKTIHKIAEIINRLQNAEFEVLDVNFGDFQA